MTITIKYQNVDKEYYFFSFDEINNYDNVVVINCYNNNLSELPKLPNSLIELYCHYNQLSVLPELPNLLQIFIVGRIN